mmetsp:Transcript_30133/g.98844  ORF Transcript_30133/g.98844 Transcript_30133/m.98844 type:complete len:207 (-) Transcript_30133:276-896(-)
MRSRATTVVLQRCGVCAECRVPLVLSRPGFNNAPIFSFRSGTALHVFVYTRLDSRHPPPCKSRSVFESRARPLSANLPQLNRPCLRRHSLSAIGDEAQVAACARRERPIEARPPLPEALEHALDAADGHLVLAKGAQPVAVLLHEAQVRGAARKQLRPVSGPRAVRHTLLGCVHPAEPSLGAGGSLVDIGAGLASQHVHEPNVLLR